MTRAEAYAEGFQEGRRWAEEDIRNRVRLDPEGYVSNSDTDHARGVGKLRGYRDTWARWDAGVLTWEMLEHAPVNR